MTRLRFYLDENVDYGPAVAKQLRARGVDTIAAVEVDRAGSGIPDQDQLDYATSNARVFVTQDLRFRPSLPHGGVVVMQKPLSVGDYILYLEIVAEEHGTVGLSGQIHFCDL